MSSKRKSIKEIEPKAYEAMLNLEAYGKTSGINPIIKE